MKLNLSLKLLFILLELVSVFDCKIKQKADTNATQKTTIAPSKFDPLKFLKHYGYLKEQKEGVKSSKFFQTISEKPEIAALKKFQKLNNLPITGEFDSVTVRKMKSPRCGFPDLLRSTSKFSKFTLGNSKWDKTNIRWKLLNHTLDLGEEKTKLAFREAFKLWSTASALTFTEVCKSCEAELKIDFATYMHDDEDEEDAFDGEGNTLAHATLPPDGRIHFDDDEHFTDSEEGINLALIAAHEIGHALGLMHSDISDALMAPYYKFTNFTLRNDDIEAIQALYGKPLSTAQTTASKTTIEKTTTTKSTKATTSTSTKIITSSQTNQQTKQTNTSATSKTYSTTSARISTVSKPEAIPFCSENYKSVFTVPGEEKSIYVIVKDDDLWRFNKKTKTWEKLVLSNEFKNLEPNVRGGSLCNKNRLWFFKENQVWAYSKFNLVKGFPKKLTGSFSSLIYNIDATINKNGKFYLIKDKLAYEFDTETLQVKGISNLQTLLGLSDYQHNIDATFNDGVQYYIFRKDLTYKIENSKTTSSGSLHEIWYPCFGFEINEYIPSTTSTTTKLVATTSEQNNHQTHHNNNNNNHHHHHHYHKHSSSKNHDHHGHHKHPPTKNHHHHGHHHNKHPPHDHHKHKHRHNHQH